MFSCTFLYKILIQALNNFLKKQAMVSHKWQFIYVGGFIYHESWFSIFKPHSSWTRVRFSKECIKRNLSVSETCHISISIAGFTMLLFGNLIKIARGNKKAQLHLILFTAFDIFLLQIPIQVNMTWTKNFALSLYWNGRAFGLSILGVNRTVNENMKSCSSFWYCVEKGPNQDQEIC